MERTLFWKLWEALEGFEIETGCDLMKRNLDFVQEVDKPQIDDWRKNFLKQFT